MKCGIYIPQVAIGFEELLARALRCEALGIDAFWIFDHLYAPGLPDQPALEGWTTATALLARTSTLRVGHLVLDNNLRHPALLARMATTLDVISDGRLELGLGSGSYAAEHHEGGFPWGTMRERTARLGEALAIITAMFEGTPVSFTGAHYQLAEVPSLPRPVQSPRPPLHIGGVGAGTLALVAAFADVWNVPTYGLGDWPATLARLEEACAAVDRDPGTIERSLEAVLVIAEGADELAAARSRAERRYAGEAWGLHDGGFVGTPAAIVDRLGQQIERGMDTVVFLPADRGAGDMIDLLAEAVLPQLR